MECDQGASCAIELGLDADQIERQIDVPRGGLGKFSLHQRMESLRDCIETAAQPVSLCTVPSAAKSSAAMTLDALRKDAENLRANIIDALRRQSSPQQVRRRRAPDAAATSSMRDMLTATGDYFRKLLANLDRRSNGRESRSAPTARKSGRDRFWNELLAIWTSIGGEETGIAAAALLDRGHVDAGVRQGCATIGGDQDDGCSAARCKLGDRMAAAVRQGPAGSDLLKRVISETLRFRSPVREPKILCI